MPGFDLKDYVDVAERIAMFRDAYPSGRLQSSVLRWPEEGFPFVAVEARAYRAADDPRPGVGMAWENFPGKTPYTKDSELMNAETSAWGRAIVAILAADTKRGGKIASAQEVQRTKPVSEEPAAGGALLDPPSAPNGPNDSDRQPSSDLFAGNSDDAGGGAVLGKGSPAPTAKKKECDHEWGPGARDTMEVCSKCRAGRVKPKVGL